MQEENIKDNWDKRLQYFTSAHNKSSSVYGYAPEQLLFGFANPAFTDLVEIWPMVTSPQEYANNIFQGIESIRTKARNKSSSWNKTNITNQNQKRLEKKFLPGQLVLHRQLQVSSGTGALKALFTGPYVIE